MDEREMSDSYLARLVLYVYVLLIIDIPGAIQCVDCVERIADGIMRDLPERRSSICHNLWRHS